MMVRLALAQMNATVGDIAGNEAKIRRSIAEAKQQGATLVVLPELALTGYPPEDLLLQPRFVAANLECLQRIAESAQGITAIVGFVDKTDDLHNSAAVLHAGRVAAIYHKSYLPNYGVFDEDRYFQPGQRPLVFTLLLAGENRQRETVMVGVNICEDIWYPAGPTQLQSLSGAQLVINISASPYHAGKVQARERMLATRAADNVVVVAYCSLVGGQDELVFDGGSAVWNERGELLARAKQFEEHLLVVDLELSSVFRRRLHDPRRRKERALLEGQTVDRVALATVADMSRSALVSGSVVPLLDPVAEVFQALVLGTRDYVRKNGFREVVIGLSGGIDSALTAAIAVEGLGPDQVIGVFMPSRYSSLESREDAEQLASNLGIRFLTVPIDRTFQAYLDLLVEPFAGRAPDVTEENLQARIRGNILMALSNKFGWLVLTTGNKSEMSVGYATLYGDMAGGFAAIKDVPKMLVYELARYVNMRGGQQVLPQRVLDKPPTAELRPGQKDEDSLPPYGRLDPILHAYVEEDQGLEEIVAMGFDEATVAEVIRMVDRSEYKRRQAPPGVRITLRAFGKDRRLPITNRYCHAGRNQDGES